MSGLSVRLWEKGGAKTKQPTTPKGTKGKNFDREKPETLRHRSWARWKCYGKQGKQGKFCVELKAGTNMKDDMVIALAYLGEHESRRQGRRKGNRGKK